MNLLEFMRSDHRRNLFPLSSNLFFVERGEASLRDYVYNKVFSSTGNEAFAQVPVAYALKDKIHLRKLLLLDPVASFYFYDFVLRNASRFKKCRRKDRMMYGYAFSKNAAIPPLKQYQYFRARKYDSKAEYKHFAKVDISNCFNSFYHHDVVQWVATNISVPESNQAGKFLRQINGSVSVNCFPQGIYPAKTLGNFFLSFIESSSELHSPRIIRFLDDVYLFADKSAVLERDVIVMQQLIGNYNLSLNPDKTGFGGNESDFDDRKLDVKKKRLLKKREKAADYDEEAEEIELDSDESEYLHDLIQQRHVAEEDVELALSLLRNDPEQVESLSNLVFSQYPHLIKQLYRIIPSGSPSGAIWERIVSRLGDPFITEFELFWIAKTIIDRFKFSSTSATALVRIADHACATDVVKAVVMEVEKNDFGMGDLKIRHMRNTPATISGICALAGIRNLVASKRNQMCNYVGNTSQYLGILAEIVKNS